MKTKNRIWLCSFIIIGFILILTNSCKKDNNNSFSMTDRDGNVYTSVTIGTQVWMVENLKTTKYRNGDLIGTTTTKDISAEATPKYQWAYDDNENNVAVYGRLYTWFAVTDTRNVCPTGWHVPSNAEWIELETYLGGEEIAGGIEEFPTYILIDPQGKLIERWTGSENEIYFAKISKYLEPKD